MYKQLGVCFLALWCFFDGLGGGDSVGILFKKLATCFGPASCDCEEANSLGDLRGRLRFGPDISEDQH